MESLAYEIFYTLSNAEPAHLICDSWFDVQVEIKRIQELPDTEKPVSIQVLEYSMDGNLAGVNELILR